MQSVFSAATFRNAWVNAASRGDAGAPITREEYEKLKEVLPVVSDDLTPAGRKEEIEERGVGYVDEEGDLVTTIVNGRDCAFCTYGPGGVCLCAVEKAYREGRIKDFRKPASCALYPVRLTRYPSFTAVNYHRWKVCRAAEVLGRKGGYACISSSKGRLQNISERSGTTN